MSLIFSRRLVLKSLACLSALTLSPLGLNLAQSADAKTLVLYFSRSGNTRKLAQMIQERLNCNIEELLPLKPYPKDYQACVDQAKAEQKQGARPKLAKEIPNLASYSTIFLGYPNWWGTMPMFFFTFLEANPLAGKTLIPFCTHGGSRFGDSLRDLKRLCPKAHIVKGLAVPGTDVSSAGSKVDAWLSELGLKSKG